MELLALLRPVWVGACVVAGVVSAHAQDLDRNKTPGQLFSSNCTACHRSPQGLAKNLGASGLPSFLRQHYTTGPAMASSLAGFLMAAGDAPTGRAARAAATMPEGVDAQRGRRPGETAVQQRKREAKAKAREEADKARAAQSRQRQPGEPATVSSDPEPVTVAIAPIPVAPDPDDTPVRRAPPAAPAYVVLPPVPAAKPEPPASATPEPAAPTPSAADMPAAPSAGESETSRTNSLPTTTAAATPVPGTPEPSSAANESPAAAQPVPLGPDTQAQAIADQSGFTAPLP